MTSYVLTIVCPDRAGIVHAVTGMLVEHGGNILESQQFDDVAENRFFMRVRFEVPGAGDAEEALTSLRAGFAPVAERFAMTWELWEATAPYRTLILVSKFSHCLNDLLFRAASDAAS
jgi:formyltetrahydrofolate deformylase